MSTNYDAIDGAGLPLGFLAATGAPGVMRSGSAGREVFRVEARTMASGHQKEAVVREGAGGARWRVVSDEGPNLKGTDLAPFPLGFFGAGLNADFVGRLMRLAHRRGIAIRVDATEILSQYYFSGSFFKGTGKGEADPPLLRIELESPAAAETVAVLLRDSLLASPAFAATGTPLHNTFALYVNGRRCPVTRVASADVPDATDPFLAHRRAPVPAPGAPTDVTVIEPLPYVAADGAPRVIAGEGTRIPITIRGTGNPVGSEGLVATTMHPTSPGSRFRITCDERADEPRAPSGLACLSAGIAFCFLTQFTRYIEYRHHKVRGIRLVQEIPFSLSEIEGELRGRIEPVETHVFLSAQEPDHVMQNLLEVAENTCYLHAALRGSVPMRIEAMLNGAPLRVAL